MSNNFEDAQKFGKEQFDTMTAMATSIAKAWQTVAAEITDYSKTTLERNASYVEQLIGAKKIDDAVQIQSDFAKSTYEGFISQATKISEICTNLARDTYRPIETAIAKVQNPSL